jgi:hypothetical protein
MTIAPTIRPLRFTLLVAALLLLVGIHLSERHELPSVHICDTGSRDCFRHHPRRAPRQRYLASVPHDGWHRPLRLTCPSRHAGGQPCDVSSAGPDGIFGTGDDINSWDL